MPATYDKIASNTLGSTASTVTFSSISGNYTDLVLIINGKMSADGIFINLRLNNDTGNTLSSTRMHGNGSTAGSSRGTLGNLLSLNPNVGWDSTDPCTVIVNIMNYSNTTTNKTMLVRTSTQRSTAGYGEAVAIVGLWQSTSAVNRVDVITGSSTFASGSTFTLYGIKAA